MRDIYHGAAQERFLTISRPSVPDPVERFSSDVVALWYPRKFRHIVVEHMDMSLIVYD
jgi:hypothetical protein